MSKHRIWFDTDTGCDDAQALLFALKLENIDVVGVSAVAGNVPLDLTFSNARNVLNLGGRSDIKVFKGAAKPLIRELVTGEAYHGKNGVGDVKLEESRAVVETKPAHEAIYEKAKELNGEMTIVAVGPLTNIATTIANHPDIVKYVKTIAIMGGAVVGGNRTACAEYNIYADPEAAETVFKSGIHVIMCGLDVTLKMYLTEEDIIEIGGYGNKVAEFLKDSTLRLVAPSKEVGEEGYVIHDSGPVFYLAHPEIFTSYECGVYVETQSHITLGKTVCDLYTDHKWEDRHCTVVMDCDRDKYLKLIKEIYRSY